MSGPVPSPSMKGMTGRSGTVRRPFAIVIFSPPAGGTGWKLDMRDLLGNRALSLDWHCCATATGVGSRSALARDRTLLFEGGWSVDCVLARGRAATLAASAPHTAPA